MQVEFRAVEGAPVALGEGDLRGEGGDFVGEFGKVRRHAAFGGSVGLIDRLGEAVGGVGGEGDMDADDGRAGGEAFVGEGEGVLQD